jgi:hypothetical protein
MSKSDIIELVIFAALGLAVLFTVVYSFVR